jgi:NDP-sugar pyrophosphorylase family protein
MAGQIESEFRDGSSRDVRIQYSREERALGTGGAVKLAEPYLQGMPDFLVMNGDSFVEIDLQEFVSFHRERGGLATIAAWEAANSARYGTIRMGEDFRVTGFLEKTGNEASGLINAGVYIFNNDVLSQLPEGPSSLERDLFPRLLDHGVYAVPQRGIFIDIGTPEDYAHAQALYNQIESAAVRGTQAGIDEA